MLYKNQDFDIDNKLFLKYNQNMIRTKYQKLFLEKTKSPSELKRFLKQARTLTPGKTSTVLKLNLIFRDGYCPSRGYREYDTKVKGWDSGSLVNCFEHSCFNLTEELLKEYKFGWNDRCSFFDFKNINLKNAENDMNELINFVKATGLEIENSSLKEKLVQDNQWKIAVYFNVVADDIHLMKQEKDGSWSSKMGDSRYVDRYPKPAKRYHYNYGLYGIFKITNPYAKPLKKDEKEFEK